METAGKSFTLLKMAILKMTIVIIFCSLLSMGVFHVMYYFGWPETVIWFFGTFIWIFVLLTGFFNIINGKETSI